MKKNKQPINIISDNCRKLYEKYGASAVYDYCNKLRLAYHFCSGCDADTPTIQTNKICECAICGQSKPLPKPINSAV